MKSIYLKFLLITFIAIPIFSCEEEPTFICERNTVFQFTGNSEKWCGSSETRHYSYNNEEESGSIFIKYPAGNVTLTFFVIGGLVVGQQLSYGNGIGLSGDIGSVNSATMVVTKLDREQGLMNFQFYFDYHAQTNLTHWDVSGTVSDLVLEVE